MPEQLSDAILLERFVSFREEAAFVALVERHGPLVQRTCRRILRNEHDVEDVFQATFLVLARRASLIPWRESVAGWLSSVAHRLALGARSDLTRQNRRETPMTTLTQGQPSGQVILEAGLPAKFHPLAEPLVDVERREAGQVINDELLLLPEKYRSPVVLCYLEGRTHEEAAHQLGWPAGSMSRRLKRAQAILRRRLIHRGFSLAVGLFVMTSAVLCAWIMWLNHGQNAGAVRSAMASLGPLTDGEGGIRTAIALIDRGNFDRDREPIASLARRATRVAGEIDRYEPGERSLQWREYLTQMRLSAALLAQATGAKDRSSMLSAARRLNASCLGCHDAFCETVRESAPAAVPLVPRAESSRGRASNRSVSWFIFEETSSSDAHSVDPQTVGAIEVALLTPQ
jgi:RNA polymerase sigma factor (sigma-70 family)